ncbi:hypothetical protein ACHHV8_09445 [Paenibacillus sp. TAB 01]|uniref:hypothetical protein n=1 Tax=Paenibacillus sp. TAB 01 TaxID=3368988 RepID=UPI003752A477
MSKKIKLRSLLIGGLFTLLFVALVGRLYWVQVVDGAELLAAAQKKWEAEEVLRPIRGAIVDRNDKVLAEDAPAYTVALNPTLIKKYHLENAVSKGLAAILKTSDDPTSIAALEDKISSRLNKTYTTVNPQIEIRNEGWKIDVEVADQVKQLVEQLKLQAGTTGSIGIYLMKEQKRFYPGGKLAAHLLGYSDKEGNPKLGLESRFDSVMKGTPGSLTYEK